MQVTTFKSWDEVGRWYRELQEPETAITPAIRAKADELTRGLSTEDAKARAIYQFVSTKFRYISLSLGVGRYQPHAADSVLANQYGDCKDKHTLFAALLKAAGVDAWPALIGFGLKLQTDVPSPAQFNHVITVIPKPSGYTWLDTTPEVAPFGLLQASLRDKKALVIPSNQSAVLMDTPADPPFASSQALEVNGNLDSSGVLKGHFEYSARGDVEVLMRAAFQAIPATSWSEFVQQMVRAEGFTGTVSNVTADPPTSLDKPFHYAFDYNGPSKNSDWKQHQLAAPLFTLMQPVSDEADKPKEAFSLGGPGKIEYRAAISLPREYSAVLPNDNKSEAEFASFESSYVQKPGLLTVKRELILKQGQIQPAAWDAYRKFTKQVADDQNQMVELSELGASVGSDPSKGNAEAARLISQSNQAALQHDLKSARDLLKQAERLNSSQFDLWANYAALDLVAKNSDKAVEELHKEIRLHSDNQRAYWILAKVQELHGSSSAASETLQAGLKVNPTSLPLAYELGTLLNQQKRYGELADDLRPVAEKTGDPAVEGTLGEALIRTGRAEEGVGAIEKFAKRGDPLALNAAAYSLADTNTRLDLAQQYAERAVATLEEESLKLTLSSTKEAALGSVGLMTAAWDTLGWVYFRKGDLAPAEKFVAAAWSVTQVGEIGDHLGQIYLKEGKKESAIHVWRLALEASNPVDETREHLQSVGAALVPLRRASVTAAKQSLTPDEELVKMRSVDLPSLPRQSASAEFDVLLSCGKVENVRFTAGSDVLKEKGAEALRAADFHLSAPDEKEKIVRHGLLSCSTYTEPSCRFILMPISSSRASSSDGPAAALSNSTDSKASVPVLAPPKLLRRTEPEYSKAALDAKLEGTVLLSIQVDDQGTPQDIQVTKSLGLGLDEKAVEAVSKWRFSPGTRDGKPVKTTASVEVAFRMRR